MHEQLKQYEDEMSSKINTLRQLIKVEINDYPDKSLIFQKSGFFEEWLNLLRIIGKFDGFDAKAMKADDYIDYIFFDWGYEEDFDLAVGHALKLYSLKNECIHLLLDFRHELNCLYSSYEKNQNGDALTGELLAEFNMEYCSECGTSIVDALNTMSHKIRHDMLDLIRFYTAMINVIYQLFEQELKKRFPSDEEIMKIIEDNLKTFILQNMDAILREMRKDLSRHYKQSKVEPETPELWSEMLKSDENAIQLAMKGELSQCNVPKQAHWTDKEKKYLDDKSRYIDLIYDLFYDDQLFDLSYNDKMDEILYFIIRENYCLFRKIIVRRNLIQCEMFPELKKMHEAWLKGNQESIPVVKSSIKGLRQYVIIPEKADLIVTRIIELVKSQTKPKAIMMPIRAAMDAGVISRPSWKSFLDEFGEGKMKSKSSFTDYTNPFKIPYTDKAYQRLLEEFHRLTHE